MNDMLRAAGVLDSAVRAMPGGYLRCCPQGTNQYPQRVTAADGTLVAECYEGSALAGKTGIGLYLALVSTAEVTRSVAVLLHETGTAWNETVEWKDSSYVHAGGCGGTVGESLAEGGCACFRYAQETAQAVLDAATYATAGEWWW